jgi:hypothetical protein
LRDFQAPRDNLDEIWQDSGRVGFAGGIILFEAWGNEFCDWHFLGLMIGIRVDVNVLMKRELLIAIQEKRTE